MEKEIGIRCVRCDDVSNNKLPLCEKCAFIIGDFDILVDFLNKFDGREEDLYWIIESAIIHRQSSIISCCRVEYDYARGKILLIPIEPSDGVARRKPWVLERFLSIKRKKDEIDKLYTALSIAKNYFSEKRNMK